MRRRRQLGAEPCRAFLPEDADQALSLSLLLCRATMLMTECACIFVTYSSLTLLRCAKPAGRQWTL